MSKNYFKKYVSRELEVAYLWRDRLNLNDIIKEIVKDNTGFHDLKAIINEKYINEFGSSFLIEIKEEENKWFCKTGNIGLDYISAFNFKTQEKKVKWTDKNQKNLWVNPQEIKTFENEDINVHKWGKLITCDANIQIFYAESERKEPILLKAYCNNCLRESVGYFKLNYALRINNKTAYESSSDTWESAAFFVNPFKDKILINCEINTLEKLKECLKKEK